MIPWSTFLTTREPSNVLSGASKMFGVVSDGGKRRRECEAVESGMTFTFIKSNIKTKGPTLVTSH